MKNKIFAAVIACAAAMSLTVTAFAEAPTDGDPVVTADGEPVVTAADGESADGEADATPDEAPAEGENNGEDDADKAADAAANDENNGVVTTGINEDTDKADENTGANPGTGIVLAIAPAALAVAFVGVTAIVSKKKRS
ncbi:MAG: hypothetical protein HDT43_06100 [Ruminococcaceae bacterium]|nr:hypothetical protein [Oscillospiraceae bacterium]